MSILSEHGIPEINVLFHGALYTDTFITRSRVVINIRVRTHINTHTLKQKHTHIFLVNLVRDEGATLWDGRGRGRGVNPAPS